MDREYRAHAAAAPPARPALPSAGYPSAGVPQSGTPATVPGPYWYHAVTEEIRAAIVAGGITPDGAALDQLAAAIRALGGRRTVLASGVTVPRDRYLAQALALPVTGYRWLELIATLPGRLRASADVQVADIEYVARVESGDGPALWGSGNILLRPISTAGGYSLGAAPTVCCTYTHGTIAGATMIGPLIYVAGNPFRSYQPATGRAIDLAIDNYPPVYDITHHDGGIYYHDIGDRPRRYDIAAGTLALLGSPTAQYATTLNGSGIAASPTGVLYVVGEYSSLYSGAYQLYTMSRADGTLTRVGSLSPQPAALPTLAYTDRLWLCDGVGVYTVDTATARMTRRLTVPTVPAGRRVLIGAWRIETEAGATVSGWDVDGGVRGYWQSSDPRTLHLRSDRADRDATVDVVGIV